MTSIMNVAWLLVICFSLNLSVASVIPEGALVESQRADLRISAFNIQVFGVSKMGKPHVVEHLKNILVRYDLTLIQEIRDASQTAIYQLLDELNSISPGDPYAMALSARLGRTSSKEQYAFFYRPSKLSVVRTYQDPDPQDVFERPPYIVHFRASGNSVGDFAFLATHVKPTDAVAEIDAFVDVYNQVSAMWGLNDWILGGDFNAGGSYVRPGDWASIRLRTDSRFLWVIGDNADTTIASSANAYDRLVLTGRVRDNYVSGTPIPFRFDTVYGLSQAEAGEVSDHVPVEMSLR